jgi:peptidoglycan/LPS O-acetylase OafA/YrhL
MSIRTTKSGRDGAVDLVRAACLILIVALHALMVGVSLGADGPILENALDAQAWFTPASWVVQVMPLFFILGGFSSLRHWERLQATGQRPADYVRERTVRLLKPSIVLVGTVGLGLVGLLVAGVPAEIVGIAGFRISQPLWFLAVYLGCSALVPLLVRAHRRGPAVTLASLGAGIVAVDALRAATDIPAFGLLNLAFVWLFAQQLGFWLADGHVERMSRLLRSALAVGSFGALVGLTASGLYSANMFTNLNPPTVCLALLAVAQLVLFSLARPALERLAGRAASRALIRTVGPNAMTIYLWHMTVLIVLAGALLLLPLPLPAPGTGEWWATRPLWLIAAALLLIPVVRALGRFERGAVRGVVRGAGRQASTAHRPARHSTARMISANALGIVGVVSLLVVGITPLTALISVTLLAAALVLTRRQGCASSSIRSARSALPSASPRSMDRREPTSSPMPTRSITPSVTVSAQMMPGRPNHRLPSSTTGMKSRPCVSDMVVAATARPVAWNVEVSNPVNPFATMATSCAVRTVAPRARTEASDTNAPKSCSRNT